MGGGIGEVTNCSKFGWLEKLLRVTCFARRFVLNLKARQMRSTGLQGGLSVAKVEKSKVLRLRYEQCTVVKEDNFEKLKHSHN